MHWSFPVRDHNIVPGIIAGGAHKNGRIPGKGEETPLSGVLGMSAVKHAVEAFIGTENSMTGKFFHASALPFTGRSKNRMAFSLAIF